MPPTEGGGGGEQAAPSTAQPNTPAPAQAQQAEGPAWSVDAFPQEIRPLAEQQFRTYEEKMRAAQAEQAKQWEPYEQIDGFKDIEPDELSELVAFRQMLADESPQGEDSVKQWLTQMAEAYGVSPGELDEDAWSKMGEEKGWFDDGSEEGQQGDSAVSERLARLEQHLEQRDRESNVKAEQAKIADELKALHEDFGDFDDTDAQAFALRYMQDDQHAGEELRKGVERLLEIKGGSQAEMVARAREGGNVTALPKGRPNTEPDKIPGFQEDPRALKQIALARANQQSVV